MADLTIRQDFLDGTEEIFTTLFNEGTATSNDGVLYYELSVQTIPDLYGEQKNKVYKNPVRLVAQVGSTPTQESYDVSALKDYANFTVPYQEFIQKNIEVSQSTLFHLRQGIIQYKDSYYRIDNVIPKAFVEDIFLFYRFECTQDLDITYLNVEGDINE